MPSDQADSLRDAVAAGGRARDRPAAGARARMGRTRSAYGAADRGSAHVRGDWIDRRSGGTTRRRAREPAFRGVRDRAGDGARGGLLARIGSGSRRQPDHVRDRAGDLQPGRAGGTRRTARGVVVGGGADDDPGLSSGDPRTHPQDRTDGTAGDVSAAVDLGGDAAGAAESCVRSVGRVQSVP